MNFNLSIFFEAVPLNSWWYIKYNWFYKKICELFDDKILYNKNCGTEINSESTAVFLICPLLLWITHLINTLCRQVFIGLSAHFSLRISRIHQVFRPRTYPLLSNLQDLCSERRAANFEAEQRPQHQICRLHWHCLSKICLLRQYKDNVVCGFVFTAISSESYCFARFGIKPEQFKFNTIWSI